MLQQIIAWQPDLAPREIERSSDADAPDRPEPWTESREDELVALAAGDRWRSWTLYSADGALIVAHERASTKISVVLRHPDPCAALTDLVTRLGALYVPSLAMAFDPESKQDEDLIEQGLERLADVPPTFFVDRQTSALIGGAAALSAGAREIREVHGGLVVCVRDVFGRPTPEDRARSKTMRQQLGLPRSFVGAVNETKPNIELVQFWPTGAEGRFRGVWSSARDRAWAVGDDGMVAFWDGSDWSLVESGTTAWLAAVSGWDDLVWIVGEHGQIFVGDGTRWSAAASGTDCMLHGVQAIARDRVIAVGERGCIMQWDGRAWSRAETDTTSGLLAVSGARNDLWAVGEGGTIVHCVEGRWLRASSPVRTDLHAVSVLAPGQAWAVGADGCVLHLKDDQWREVDVGRNVHLHGVFAFSNEDVWVVGDACTILHWDGRSWRAVPSDTREELFATYGADDRDVWIVGSDSLILRTKTA